MGGIVMKPFNLEEYLANPKKKVVTRDGRDVRIICTDRVAKEYKLVALVMKNDTECMCAYNTNGCVYKNDTHSLDLFFAPEKHEGWMNIYRARSYYYGGSVIYPTEVAAKAAADPDPVATIKIEWEE